MHKKLGKNAYGSKIPDHRESEPHRYLGMVMIDASEAEYLGRFHMFGIG